MVCPQTAWINSGQELSNTRYHGFKSKSNTYCRAPQDLLVVERHRSIRTST